MLNWYFKWGVESPLSLIHVKRQKKLFSSIGNSFGGINIWLSPKGRAIICLKWFFSLTSEISENSIVLVICYCIKKYPKVLSDRHLYHTISVFEESEWGLAGCLCRGFSPVVAFKLVSPGTSKWESGRGWARQKTESFCNLNLELTSQKPVIARSSLHSKGKDYTRAGTI